MLPANWQESGCLWSSRGTRYKQCSRKIALGRQCGREGLRKERLSTEKNGLLPLIYLEKNMTARATRKTPLGPLWCARLPNLKQFAQAFHHNSCPKEDAGGDVWPMKGRRNTVGRLDCLHLTGSSRRFLPREKCVLTFRERNSVRHHSGRLRLWRFIDHPRAPRWGPQL